MLQARVHERTVSRHMFTEKYTTQSPQINRKKSVKYQPAHVRTGNIGENYVKQLLRDSGYLAKKRRKKRLAGDLWTFSTLTQETLNIEVKTANESQSGTYRFCLRKEGKTDICHSDFVVLVCIDKHGNKFVYCIPCQLLDTVSLTISSHPLRYAGKYTAFRIHNRINFDDTLSVGALWIQ